jgi:hypothetical protein
MNQTDEWERDPSIQIMRRVFRAMEDAQAQLLRRLGINPYDIRVREWREKALELFERAWMTANRMGMNMDEGTASALYVRGLAKIMSSDGVEIPSGILPAEEEVEKIFMEILK